MLGMLLMRLEDLEAGFQQALKLAVLRGGDQRRCERFVDGLMIGDFRLTQKTPKEAKGHLDDNEISSSGARCAGVTGLHAWEPRVAKIRRQRQSSSQHASHPIHWMPVEEGSTMTRIGQLED
jgi:hypothetical protein